MNFEKVAQLTRDVPVMGEREGRKLYEHVRETKPGHVLEFGTAHGVSACYLAAALEANGHGRLTTVDHRSAAYVDPSANELFLDVGLADRIDRVLIDDSSYTWWLKRQLEARRDEAGNVEPVYDFCFLDGAHNWTIDGLAVLLVEPLLTEGAWLLLDDLDWSYAAHGDEISVSPPSDKMFPLSTDELETPHVGAIVDVILKSHPAFGEIRIEDDRWAWCLKHAGSHKRLSIETSRPLPVLVSLAAQRGVRRARALLARLFSRAARPPGGTERRGRSGARRSRSRFRGSP